MDSFDDHLRFAQSHKRGQIINGPITKIVPDMGLMVRLEPAVDGLVHLSDIDWEREGGEAILDYQLGRVIDTVILRIEPERQRISLGIKQLSAPPPPRKPWRRPPPGSGAPSPVEKGPVKGGPRDGASEKLPTDA